MKPMAQGLDFYRDRAAQKWCQLLVPVPDLTGTGPLEGGINSGAEVGVTERGHQGQQEGQARVDACPQS